MHNCTSRTASSGQDQSEIETPLETLIEAVRSAFLAEGDAAYAPDRPGQTRSDPGSVPIARRVSKPWGREHWIIHGDVPYLIKLIVVNAGARTSLQYHHQKDETNIVLAGDGFLHHQADANSDLEVLSLCPGTMFRVRPRTRHRIEAVARLVMLELSTPHPDDVVRVDDDYGRLSSPGAAPQGELPAR